MQVNVDGIGLFKGINGRFGDRIVFGGRFSCLREEEENDGIVTLEGGGRADLSGRRRVDGSRVRSARRLRSETAAEACDGARR